MTSWNSYGKIYNLGHRATQELFDGPVTIEEKIDGSQFSFGLIDGELLVRSRGRVFDINEAQAMFAGACATVQDLHDRGMLLNGWTYRGEVLAKPRHNVLCYDRAPKGNVILWDIAVEDQDYLPYADKAAEAARLGLEIVPLLFEGVVDGQELLDSFKSRTSILGGPIEGFVVKNYSRFGRDKKTLMGKWVSDSFKEVHKKEFKSDGNNKKDVEIFLADKYTTIARWQKAVQRMHEAGTLLGEMRDMKQLMQEVPADLLKECEEEIKQDLFNAYWPRLKRNCTKGLAEWYKKSLERDLFDE